MTGPLSAHRSTAHHSTALRRKRATRRGVSARPDPAPHSGVKVTFTVVEPPSAARLKARLAGR